MSDGQTEPYAMGAPALWGFTPAIDLLDDLYVHGEESRPLFYDSKESLESAPTATHLKATELNSGGQAEASLAESENILLVGTGDIRHVLKTAAHLRRWRRFNKRLTRSPAVRFFIEEPALEVLARTLLQWAIVVDETISMQTRVELFLELYGNTMIRGKTLDYLKQRAIPRLLEMFLKDNSELSQWFDLSLLKSRERDEIEGHIRYWLNPTPPLKMPELRDYRMRKYFGSRYDSRPNLYDWDMTMLLHATCSIIHRINYQRFRETGICYETREATCSEPNPTLATLQTAMEAKKGRIQLRGYWSDILVSPFIAFGVESVERDHFERRQGQHIRSVVVVSEAEVLATLCGIEHGRYFCLPDALRKGGDERARQRRTAETEQKDSTTSGILEKDDAAGVEDNEAEEESDGKGKGATDTTAQDVLTVTQTADETMQAESPQLAGQQPSTETPIEAATLPTTPYPPSLPRVPIKLVLLPPEGHLKLAAKAAYKGQFRRGYFGYLAALKYTESLNRLFVDGDQSDALISLDTLKYVPLREESKSRYAANVERIMNTAGWTLENPTRSVSPSIKKPYSSTPTHVSLPMWDEDEDREIVKRRMTLGTQRVQSFGDAQVLDGPSASREHQISEARLDNVSRELKLCGSVTMDNVPFSVPCKVYATGATYTKDTLLSGSGTLYDLRSNLTFRYSPSDAKARLASAGAQPLPKASDTLIPPESVAVMSPTSNSSAESHVVGTGSASSALTESAAAAAEVSASSVQRKLNPMEEHRRRILELKTQQLKAKERRRTPEGSEITTEGSQQPTAHSETRVKEPESSVVAQDDSELPKGQ